MRFAFAFLQVCLDRFVVSSDPLTAQLMDGDLVAAWAVAASARLRQSVEACLPNGAHQQLPETGRRL